LPARLKFFLRTEASSSDSEAAAAPGPDKKHKLCVLSRIHNQPRSLAEWLEYHAALGITRFLPGRRLQHRQQADVGEM